jgi:hypothetical protein
MRWMGLLSAIALLWIVPLGCNLIGPQRVQLTTVPASVNVGQRLAWRELDRLPLNAGFFGLGRNSGALGGLYSGNFDHDTDQEVILIGYEHGQYYDANGVKHKVGIHGAAFLMEGAAWDSDGDGVDEIVCEAIAENIWKQHGHGSANSLPNSTPIYALDGGLLTRLPGVQSSNQLLGDYDGDGRPDLILPANALEVHAPGGTSLGMIRTASGMYIAEVMADLDGDGCAEYCRWEKNSRTLAAYGDGQQRKSYAWTKAIPSIAGVADLNADGCQELLLGLAGYYDPAVERQFGYSIPAAYQASNLDITNKCVAGDFDGDQQAEVAVAVGEIPFGTGVMLFDASGTCEYYEEFGDTLWGLVALHSGGKDYLVCQLTDRLLIYP